MLMRKLGRTGLSVAALCLGGNTFGWTTDQKASEAVLDAYMEAGGNFIDTADVYARWAPGNKGGESETVLGTQPTCTTTYSAGDDIGTYATTCSGGADNNYKFSYVAGSFKVTKKALTPSFHADDKTYDGNATATIKDRHLAGIVGTDDVDFGGGTASFDNKNAGTAKTVTWSGFSLNGTKAGNYSLTDTTITASADINKAELTVTASSPADITYGDPRPSSHPNYSGFVSGESETVVVLFSVT